MLAAADTASFRSLPETDSPLPAARTSLTGGESISSSPLPQPAFAGSLFSASLQGVFLRLLHRRRKTPFRSAQFLFVVFPLRSAPLLRHCFFVSSVVWQRPFYGASLRGWSLRPSQAFHRPPSAASVSVPSGVRFHLVPRFQLSLRRSAFCRSGLPVHRLRRPPLRGRLPFRPPVSPHCTPLQEIFLRLLRRRRKISFRSAPVGGVGGATL